MSHAFPGVPYAASRVEVTSYYGELTLACYSCSACYPEARTLLGQDGISAGFLEHSCNLQLAEENVFCYSEIKVLSLGTTANKGGEPPDTISLWIIGATSGILDFC